MLRIALVTLIFEPMATLKAVYYWLFGRKPAAKAEGKAILLIHGNYHNDSAWIPLMKKLDRPVYTVNLPSGRITKADLDIIEQKLQEIPEAVVDVVGHSRGADIAYRIANWPRIGTVIRLGATTHEKRENVFDIDAVNERINVKEEYGFLVNTGHLGLLYHPVVHRKILEMLESGARVKI